jgi:hypothetical protein
VAGTDRMLKLAVGDTERCCGGKLKNWKGFSKPNFEPGPNVCATCVVSNLFNQGRHKVVLSITVISG